MKARYTTVCISFTEQMRLSFFLKVIVFWVQRMSRGRLVLWCQGSKSKSPSSPNLRLVRVTSKSPFNGSAIYRMCLRRTLYAQWNGPFRWSTYCKNQRRRARPLSRCRREKNRSISAWRYTHLSRWPADLSDIRRLAAAAAAAAAPKTDY